MGNGLDGTQTQISVPLEQWVKEIVRETIKETLPEHTRACEAMLLVPVVRDTAEKVDKLRMRFATLIGFMIGSGALGGAAGAVVVKILGA